jgi:uncharacterized membrane protein YbhN (UPF0104 family)
VKKKLRLAASLLLLALLAWTTDWHRVAEDFSHLRWGLWLASVGILVGAQLASTLRWQMLARPLGFQMPLGRFVAVYFIGMFFNLVLPTSVGGDVVRAWYLAGTGDAAPPTGRRLAAFVSVFVDRLNGLLVLLVIACVAAAVCPLALPARVTWSVWGLALAAVIGLVGIAVAPRLPLPLGRFPGLRDRLHNGRDRLTTALGLYVRQPRLLLAASALSLVVQLANIVLVWLIGVALNLPVPLSYYFLVVPLVAILTLVPISLNGMGVREFAMIALLAPLGVAAGTALSLSFLWFATTVIVSLSGVVFYIAGRFPRLGAAPAEDFHEVRPEHGPVRGDSDQGRTGQSQAAA